MTVGRNGNGSSPLLNGNGHTHSPHHYGSTLTIHSPSTAKYHSGTVSPSAQAIYALQPKSTWYQSVSTTFKSIVGSGICALPFAFYACGWFAGTLGLITIAFASCTTMHQMITCVHIVRQKLIQSGELNYDDKTPLGYRQIGSYCYGRTGKLIVDIALITSQLGGNCAFIAFILSCIHSTLEALNYRLSFTMIMCILFPILVMLTIPRSTTHLASVSHIGNIALAVGVGTVFYFGVTHTTPTLIGLPAYKNGIFGICTFFGIAAYSLCAHAEVMAVEHDADNSSRYRRILNSTMFVITTLYIIFAIFAYSCFHEYIKSNIFLNLGNGIFVMIMKIAMAVVVMFNYPISLIPATKTIEEWVFPTTPSSSQITSPLISSHVTTVSIHPKHESNGYIQEVEDDGEEEYSTTYYYWMGNVLRVILVLVTCVVALLLNDFGLLAALVGSLTGGLLSFVLPPIFYLTLQYSHLSRWDITIVILQLIFGISLMCTGIVVVLQV